MLYKLLAVSKSSKLVGVNIGDYIQALASSQYYPQIDGFLDRDEELKDYNGESCKMIMNGWYMHNPSNWPPSENIDPLFVAFHLNIKAKEQLLSPESIAYLKHHEPIGCRDLNTMEILKSQGINAYFSACMTLTLGKTFHSEEKEDTSYIVDPQMDCPLDVKNIIKAVKTILHHPIDIYKLCKKEQLYLHHGRNLLKKIIKTARYYKEYTQIFGRDLIMNSVYICQEDKYYTNNFQSDEERLKEAERLVRLYSKAQLVITSRIHCALPCLGIETPVIYLEKSKDSEASTCRLGGLKDLFNIVSVKEGKLTPNFNSSLPITKNNFPKNKDTWKEYAKLLDNKCSEFISK